MKQSSHKNTRRVRRLSGYIAAAALSGTLAATAHGQFTGACCSPSGVCTVSTPYDCAQSGGVFAGYSIPCEVSLECDPMHPGVGMSQIAARRLLRQGVVHTLHVGNSLPVYQADHPMWDLLAQGVIIAPEIYLNVLEAGQHDPEMTLEESAEFCAALMLTRAEEAMDAFATAHPGKPFYWTLHLAGLGAGWTWQVAEDSQLPIFTHHEDDVVDDKLKRREYVRQAGLIGEVHENGDQFQAWPQGSGSPWELFGQFSEDYFLEPWPVTFKILGENRSAQVTAYDRVNRIFTLSEPILTEADEYGSPPVYFELFRNDMNYSGLLPCYFFKHGAEEMGNWVQAFCAYMADEENWPEGLPEPSAVIVTDEDIGEASVDWLNYKDYWNDTTRANADMEDPDEFGWTIDGVRNLRTWHTAFAPEGFENPNEFEPESGAAYSPLNAEIHSYLLATVQTAYNYHREQSTWQHFRALWPRAQLSQYQLGNGYGVTHDEEPYEVPIGPGEASFHGQRTWLGPVSWDEYHCGISSYGESFPFESDPQVIPVTYNSGTFTTGTAADGTSYAANEFPVDGTLSISPGYYLDLTTLPGRPIKLYIEFLTAPNDGYIYEVADWDSGVFTLTENLAEPSDFGQPFRVYYPSFAYEDYAVNGPMWPFMKTFCDRYGEPVNAAGLVSTAKKWAAESARAQTRALPDNPYSVYYGPGGHNTGYDGVTEKVSILATYPSKGFESQDGWLNGYDWGAIASQAMDYGVNHFVWFFPDMHETTANMTTMLLAMDAVRARYAANLPVYANIACIGDWDMSGTINAADVTAFGDDLITNLTPEADLNNDGLHDEEDEALYNNSFCGGGCAPIQSPGCSNEEDCEIADWCDDGFSGVEDIFCFLEDWFANDYDAQNFGGTAGVPAIFAFLNLWFSVGVRECDP